MKIVKVKEINSGSSFVANDVLFLVIGYCHKTNLYKVSTGNCASLYMSGDTEVIIDCKLSKFEDIAENQYFTARGTSWMKIRLHVFGINNWFNAVSENLNAALFQEEELVVINKA